MRQSWFSLRDFENPSISQWNKIPGVGGAMPEEVRPKEV